MNNTKTLKGISKFHRAVSLFVLTAFVSTSLFSVPSFAVSETTVLAAQKSLPDNLLSIEVPDALGKIQEVYQAASRKLQAAGECLRPEACSVQPVVVLIQDAHAIPDAQRNIHKLIGYFQKEYGIRLVALEGAASQLDPQIFKSFPDKEILKKTFEEYFEKGELSGTSAAAIFNERPAIYQGIEDWDLYEAGLSFYLKSMQKERELEKMLRAAGIKLQKEKEKVYSEQLLEVDKALESFKENSTDLMTVLKKLDQIRGYSPDKGIVPLSVQTLLEEIEKEDKDQSAIEMEVRGIAEEIKRHLLQATSRKSQDDDDPAAWSLPVRQAGLKFATQKVSDTFSTFLVSDTAAFNQKYQEFQTSRISPEGFALFMKELIESHRHESWVLSLEKVHTLEKGTGLPTGKAGNTSLPVPFSFSRKLTQLMKNHKRMRDIEGTMFFREFEHYSKWVKQSLFTNDKQRQLDARTRELELLEKLAKLELSREDWNEIKTHNLPDYAAHFAFYANAEKRDKVFLSNLLSLMNSVNRLNPLNSEKLSFPRFSNSSNSTHPTNSAILVAGGFHTEGLAAKFKETGISYMVVMPQMDSIPEHSVYREQMKGDVSWKDYFRVENGKIDFYKAFVRGARDKLLQAPQAGLLKAWRDQIIRDLVRKEQTVKVREYTQFMDELTRNNTKSEVRAQRQIKLERFIKGLRALDTVGQLTKQNILKLFNPSTRPADAVSAALANGDGASLAHLSQLGLSGHIFEKLAEERSEMLGDSGPHNVDRALDRVQAMISTAQREIETPDLLSDHSFRIQVRMTVLSAKKALEDLNDVALMRDQENRRNSLKIQILALYDQLNAAARDSQPPQLRSEVRSARLGLSDPQSLNPIGSRAEVRVKSSEALSVKRKEEPARYASRDTMGESPRAEVRGGLLEEGNKVFQRNIGTAQNGPQRSWLDGLSAMNWNNRPTAKINLVAKNGVSAALSHKDKAGFLQGAYDTLAGNLGKIRHQAAISLMNILRFSSARLSSLIDQRYKRIAFRIFARASRRVSPWEAQPGSSGTYTLYPPAGSSSRMILYFILSPLIQMFLGKILTSMGIYNIKFSEGQTAIAQDKPGMALRSEAFDEKRSGRGSEGTRRAEVRESKPQADKRGLQPEAGSLQPLPRSEVRTDAEKLSDEERRQIAQWAVQSLVHMKGLVEEKTPEFAQFEAKVTGIFKRLLHAAGVKDADAFELLMVAEPEPNAMIAVDAQKVIITQGLIKEMERYVQTRKKPVTEDFLAFILAHELNHYQLRANHLQEPIIKEEGEPGKTTPDEDEDTFERTRDNSFAHLLGYREEYLADNRAIRLMDQAGYNPLEAVRAAEFIKFIQDKEWEYRLAEVDQSVRIHPDDEIKMLEDIRKDKLRRNFIPSIIDTHPRTQNRIQALYLLTLNRLFKNEDKAPVSIEIPHLESSYGKREIFWNQMMANLAEHRIVPFIAQAQTPAQMEDLALLYFLMTIALSQPLLWASSYDMADLAETEKKIGLIAVEDSYDSIPYIHLVKWYLNKVFKVITARKRGPDPSEFLQDGDPEGPLIDPTENDERLFALQYDIEADQHALDKLNHPEEDDDDGSHLMSAGELRKGLKESIKFNEMLQKFFDRRIFLVLDNIKLANKDNIYRILFTPWGKWNDEETRRELATDKLLTSPFRHPPYRRLLGQGRKLFERDHSKVKGIRRDMLLWLLFHSYYPNPAGYQLIQQIEKKLKNPEDLLFALRHLPAKQYDDERLRRAFAGYSGFAYLEMLVHYFIPRLYLSLNENEAFRSAGEMMNFLGRLSKELAYLKAAVHTEIDPSFKQGGLSRVSLYQDLFDELLQVSLAKMKTRQDFEELARFWSEADGIPKEAMNEEALAKAIKSAGILGQDIEKDLQLVAMLTRGTTGTNHLVKVLLGAYPQTKENFLKMVPLIADSRDFSVGIQQFLLDAPEWQALSFTEKFKRLQELQLILPQENYVEILKAHEDVVDPAQFLEAIQTVDSFPKGHLQYAEFQKIKKELGKRIISALRNRKDWQEGSEEHFKIIGKTMPDSEKKMKLLEAIVNKAGARLEHYQRAVSAIAIGKHKDERFAKIKTLAGGADIEEEFRKRKRDPAYHRTHRENLKDPKEVEKESLSPLFKQKLLLGQEGWKLAEKLPGFKSASLEEKLKLVESLFPDPSPVREDLLKALQAEYRSELRNQNGTDYLNEQLHLLRLASDPVWRIQLGREAMSKLRDLQPDLFQTFESHKDLILRLFPDFSLERDRQLSRLIDSHDSSFAQTQSVNGYFLEDNEEYTTEEAVVFGMAGMETFRDYMHVTPPSEKVELLLWLLDLQVKPEVVDVMEQTIGYNALSIKEGMKEAGPDENRIFLQEILLGQNGIFSDGQESDMQYLLDRIFLLVFPDELHLNPEARKRLKTLFDALFHFSTPKRRADLMIALANSKNEHLALPQTIRVFLQAYGTLGIKVGQYLAVRTSLLPKEIRDELLKLTDRAEPFLKQRAYEMVQVEFGVENPEEIFPRIGKRLSTASFKQVYEGTIKEKAHSGEFGAVTLKVIRPAAKKEMTGDLDTFVNLIHYISENPELFGFSLPQDMGGEIRRRTLEEMDFQKEREKQERKRLDLAKRWGSEEPGNSIRNDLGYRIQVPEVRTEYTRKTVFVDDLAPGLPLTREKEVEKDHKFSDLSQTLVKEFLDQIFLDGFYHGDPHPGNMLVSQDKTISLIDFGITGTLSPRNRDRLFDLLQFVIKKDEEGLVKLALEFYAEMEPSARPEISLNEIQTVIRQILAQSFQPSSLGKSIYDVLDQLNRAGIRLPAEFYTLIGTLTAMDYWFSKIDPFQLAFFLLRLFGEYQSVHEAQKASHPIERISRERLEEIRSELSQVKNGTKPEKKKQTTVASSSIGQIEEIWKISKMERGTRFRFKGKEDEIWKLTYDAAPRSGSSLVLERETDNAAAQDPDLFGERIEFIADSWVKARRPLFPNDGTEFLEDRGESDFEKYFDTMVDDEHPWAVRIAGKASRKWEPIKTLQVFFSKIQPYEKQTLYEKYQEGEKVFRNYLFKRLGIPKKSVEELVRGMKDEIGEGRIELKEVVLSEGNIQQLQILEDNEKWVDFASLQLSKGLASPRSEVRSEDKAGEGRRLRRWMKNPVFLIIAAGGIVLSVGMVMHLNKPAPVPIPAQKQERLAAKAEIEGLIKDLRDPKNRQHAKNELIDIGKPAVPALVEELGKEIKVWEEWQRKDALFDAWFLGTDVADAVIQVLGETKDPSSIPILIRAGRFSSKLSGRFKTVHESLKVALSQMGEPAIPALVDMAAKDDFPLQHSSAFARQVLVKMGPRAIPGLIEAMNYKPFALRGPIKDIESILAEMGEAAVPPLLEILKGKYYGEIEDSIRNVLVRIGQPSVPFLIEALSSDDYRYRDSVSGILSAMGKLAVPPLIDAVKSKDAKMRDRAVSVLERIEDKSIVPDLISILKNDEDGYARGVVAAALGRFHEQASVAVLIEALKDQDGQVRRKAAEALGRIKDKSAVPGLIEKLKDENSGVRSAAAEALWKIRDPSSAPALIEALNDGDSVVVDKAIRTLADLRYAAAVPALIERSRMGFQSLILEKLEVFDDPRAQFYFLLYRRKAEEAAQMEGAVALAREALTHPDWHVRNTAKEVLVQKGEYGVKEKLYISWKESPVWTVLIMLGLTVAAYAAIEWLLVNTVIALGARRFAGMQGPLRFLLVTGIPIWMNLWENRGLANRKRVIELLGGYGSQANAKTVGALVTVVQTERLELGDSAAYALGRIKNPVAVPDLISVLTHGRSISKAVAEALREIGTPAALFYHYLYREDVSGALGITGKKELAIEAMKHSNPVIKKMAIRVLAEFEAAVAVPEIIKALEDNDYRVRLAALAALTDFAQADSSLVPVIIKALENNDSSVRRAALAALVDFAQANSSLVPVITRTLEDNDSSVRVAALVALADFARKDASLVPVIIKSLEDRNSGVRRAALVTLVAFARTDASLVSVIINALEDRDSGVRRAALDALVDFARKDASLVPVIINALEDRDSGVRRAALDALVDFARKDASLVPVISKALEDRDSGIRRAALDALVDFARTDAQLVLVISKALEDADSGVRRAALDALVDFARKDASLVPVISKALEDRDSGIRRAALDALVDFARADALLIPVIIKALEHADNDVRRAALDAAVDFARTDASLVPAIIKALKDTDSDVRRAALTSLLGFIRINPSLKNSPDFLNAVTDYLLRPFEAIALNQFVTIGGKFRLISEPDNDRTLFKPTFHPDDLAKQILEKIQKHKGKEADLQFSVGFDTGNGKYKNRGKFLALALFILSSDRDAFRALDVAPKRDPGAAYGILIRGINVQQLHPRNLERQRLDYVFPLSPKLNTRGNLKRFISILQSLNLGLLLTTLKQEVEEAAGGPFPYDDAKKENIAKIYQLFERDFIRILRKYDWVKNEILENPEKMFHTGEAKDDEERLEALKQFALEEALDPARKWLVDLGQPDSYWNLLLPYLRGIEGIILHQGLTEDGVTAVGEAFIQDVTNLLFERAMQIRDLLDGKEINLREAKVSQDPFIQPSDPDATGNYIKRIARAMQQGELSSDSLWDRAAFDYYAKEFGAESRSELRKIRPAIPVPFNNPAKVPRRAPIKIPKPEPIPAPAPAPSRPVPAPAPAPAPAKPAPKPEPVPAGKGNVSDRSEVRLKPFDSSTPRDVRLSASRSEVRGWVETFAHKVNDAWLSLDASKINASEQEKRVLELSLNNVRRDLFRLKQLREEIATDVDFQNLASDVLKEAKGSLAELQDYLNGIPVLHRTGSYEQFSRMIRETSRIIAQAAWLMSEIKHKGAISLSAGAVNRLLQLGIDKLRLEGEQPDKFYALAREGRSMIEELSQRTQHLHWGQPQLELEIIAADTVLLRRIRSEMRTKDSEASKVKSAALKSAQHLNRPEVRSEMWRKDYNIRKLGQWEGSGRYDQFERGASAGLRRGFQSQRVFRLEKYRPQFLQQFLWISSPFLAGTEYIKHQLLDQIQSSLGLTFLFKPISGNQYKPHAFISDHNFQNLTTEVLLRQIPSFERSLGFVGVGHRFLNHFAGQFPLRDSLSDVMSIIKYHILYDIYKFNNVNRIHSVSRLEVRSARSRLSTAQDVGQFAPRSELRAFGDWVKEVEQAIDNHTIEIAGPRAKYDPDAPVKLRPLPKGLKTLEGIRIFSDTFKDKLFLMQADLMEERHQIDEKDDNYKQWVNAMLAWLVINGLYEHYWKGRPGEELIKKGIEQIDPESWLWPGSSTIHIPPHELTYVYWLVTHRIPEGTSEEVRWHIEELMSEYEDDVPWWAARDLQQIDSENDEDVVSAFPALIYALGNEDAWMRQVVMEALDIIVDHVNAEEVVTAVPALIHALGDEAAEVRGWAAMILGAIGSNNTKAVINAVPVLIHALEDEDAEVRWRVAGALGQIGGTNAGAVVSAVHALIHALADKDARVRMQAAYALGRIGENSGRVVISVVAALIPALGDEEEKVRLEVAGALDSIMRKSLEAQMLMREQSTAHENEKIRAELSRILPDIESNRSEIRENKLYGQGSAGDNSYRSQSLQASHRPRAVPGPHKQGFELPGSRAFRAGFEDRWKGIVQDSYSSPRTGPNIRMQTRQETKVSSQSRAEVRSKVDPNLVGMGGIAEELKSIGIAPGRSGEIATAIWEQVQKKGFRNADSLTEFLRSSGLITDQNALLQLENQFEFPNFSESSEDWNQDFRLFLATRGFGKFAYKDMTDLDFSQLFGFKDEDLRRQLNLMTQAAQVDISPANIQQLARELEEKWKPLRGGEDFPGEIQKPIHDIQYAENSSQFEKALENVHDAIRRYWESGTRTQGARKIHRLIGPEEFNDSQKRIAERIATRLLQGFGLSTQDFKNKLLTSSRPAALESLFEGAKQIVIQMGYSLPESFTHQTNKILARVYWDLVHSSLHSDAFHVQFETQSGDGIFLIGIPVWDLFGKTESTAHFAATVAHEFAHQILDQIETVFEDAFQTSDSEGHLAMGTNISDDQITNALAAVMSEWIETDISQDPNRWASSLGYSNTIDRWLYLQGRKIAKDESPEKWAGRIEQYVLPQAVIKYDLGFILGGIAREIGERMSAQPENKDKYNPFELAVRFIAHFARKAKNPSLDELGILAQDYLKTDPTKENEKAQSLEGTQSAPLFGELASPDETISNWQRYFEERVNKRALDGNKEVKPIVIDLLQWFRTVEVVEYGGPFLGLRLGKNRYRLDITERHTGGFHVPALERVHMAKNMTADEARELNRELTEYFHKAIEGYQKVIQADPEKTWALQNLMNIYNALRDWKSKTILIWRMIYRMPNNNLDAWKNLESTYALAGHQKASQWINEHVLQQEVANLSKSPEDVEKIFKMIHRLNPRSEGRSAPIGLSDPQSLKPIASRAEVRQKDDNEELLKGEKIRERRTSEYVSSGDQSNRQGRTRLPYQLKMLKQPQPFSSSFPGDFGGLDVQAMAKTTTTPAATTSFKAFGRGANNTETNRAPHKISAIRNNDLATRSLRYGSNMDAKVSNAPAPVNNYDHIYYDKRLLSRSELRAFGDWVKEVEQAIENGTIEIAGPRAKYDLEAPIEVRPLPKGLKTLNEMRAYLKIANDNFLFLIQADAMEERNQTDDANDNYKQWGNAILTWQVIKGLYGQFWKGKPGDTVISKGMAAIKPETWLDESNQIYIPHRELVYVYWLVTHRIPEGMDEYVREHTELLINHENPLVRWTTAEALAREDNAEDALSAIPILIHALRDEYSFVPSFAAGTLYNIGRNDAEIMVSIVIPALIHALGDERANVHVSVASTLGEIGSHNTGILAILVPTLIHALGNKIGDEWALAIAAAAALDRIGRNSLETQKLMREQAEVHENENVRAELSRILQNIESNRSEIRENKLRVKSAELGVNPETQNAQLATQNSEMNELVEVVLGSEGIEQVRAHVVAGFVRSEVRRVGLGRFVEAFRQAAFAKINENSSQVSEWTVQAVQYLTKHWSELLSAEGEKDETFTLGLHLLGGDDALTVESFVEALLREGVPGGLKRIIATGNPKAIVPFQKQIEKAELTLATVRNPDQVKGLESYIPILSKGAKNPSRNPDVVNVGVDPGTVNPESWNPVLGVGESGSQVALSLMLLRRIPDLKGVSRAEVRTLLKQISNQLFPGLEGEEILKWEIQDSSAGGLQLSLNINRSGFMQYVTDLAAQLKARSEIRKAA